MALIDNIKHRNKSTRYYSSKQERQVAKSLLGKVTPNSGATKLGGKADVNIENLISIECKTKTKSSASVTIKKE